MPYRLHQKQYSYYYKGKAYNTPQEVADVANVDIALVRKFIKSGQSLNGLDDTTKHSDTALFRNFKVKGKVYATVDALAKEFHCSASTVRKALRERATGVPVEDIWLEE